MTPLEFKTLLAEKGILLTEQQMQQYALYYRLLVEWNEKMNLTAIIEERAVYLKHFYDSLTLALETNLLDGEKHLCDVGAGAGFPSVPLKIALPHLRLTIVDSLNKRINFLNELVSQLGLSNVSCYHDRAEVFGQNKRFREQFDIVTARAVARLNLLSEYCIPLVKVGGCFVAMKASSSQEEKEEAIKAFEVLGATLAEDIAFELPKQEGQRHIIVVQKNKNTPKKYPRKAGLPAKNPIR